MEIIIAKGIKINLWSLKSPIIVEVNGLVRTILLLCWYCYVVDLQKTSNSLVFFSNYLLEENIPNLGTYIDSDTLEIFKAKIKKWVPVQCACRLCKIYLPQAGFV